MDKVNCHICGSPKVKNKGICGPCSRLNKLLDEVENWDLSDGNKPKILVLHLPPDYDKTKLKESAIRAINKFLKFRKHLKWSMENDNITGIDIEHLLIDLLSRLPKLKSKDINSRLFQVGNFFDLGFDKKQKVELYRLFKSTYYEIPMEPIKIQIIHEYGDDKFTYRII